MKLAIVRQKYNPFGGAERFVTRALISLQTQTNLEVQLIARQWQGNQFPVMTCNPWYLGRTWRDFSFARAVSQIIKRGQFDLIQSHERIPGCHIYRAGDGVHATWLSIRNSHVGLKLAAALSPWHQYTLAAERRLFTHPALRLVICNSQMVQQDIIVRFQLPAERTVVIRNGVDLQQFNLSLRPTYRANVRQQLNIPATAPVVLCVGSGFARKGVFNIIEAMPLLHGKNIHLLVVGHDKHLANAQKRAQHLGLSHHIHLLGGQNDVRPYYAAADVFCLPTFYDPMPNATLEAFACGLPVITSEHSGTAELITTAEQGCVVKAGNVADIADAMDRTCALTLAQPKLIMTAARAIAETQSNEGMMQQLLNVYQQVIANR